MLADEAVPFEPVRSASGPGTEADHQQGGGEDPGALRAARTSGKSWESRTTPELFQTMRDFGLP
jgi:hypothetical protein